MTVTVKAPAKLNFYLDIVGLDERRYHLMEMLMQSIDLYDTLTLTKTVTGVALSCEDPAVPCDERNICHRCAVAFFEKTGVTEGVAITIEKRIPMQAGMAGGSADGAATLVGLNGLFQTGLSMEELCQIGEKIGADIPFCLIGGTAKVTGFGEKIEPLSPFLPCSLVVVKPSVGISTKAAFDAFDQSGTAPRRTLQQMIDASANDDLQGVCANLYNALETVCPLPELEAIKARLRALGAIGAMMTGSGSAIFGIFDKEETAAHCFSQFKAEGAEVFLCHAVPHGAR